MFKNYSEQSMMITKALIFIKEIFVNENAKIIHFGKTL